MTTSNPAGSARGLGASATPYTPPFSVQGSCVLSEDYFLTGQVIIGDNDLIRPYVRPDGTVEALVVQDGNLAYLHRDPTATSGWTYTVLSGQVQDDTVIPNGITDVAVGTDTYGNVMGVFVTPSGESDGQPYQVAPLLWDTSIGVWYTSDPEYWDESVQLSPFRAGLDSAGNLYFYAWDGSGNFWLYQWSGIDFNVQQVSGPGVSDVKDAFVLWNFGWDATWARAGGIVLANSQGEISWYPQTGAFSADTLTGYTEGPGTLLWAGRAPNPNYVDPTFAFQDQTSGNVFFTDTQGQLTPIWSFGALTGPGQVAVWQTGGLYTFAVLFNDTVNVIAQYSDPEAADAVTDPIPLQPDVMQVFAAPADPAQGTLFAVMADATLSVLTKDQAAGWSLVPIQQDVATLQELDTWRVQLSVTDANGAGVAGAQVSVSADRPAGTWQYNSSTLLGPGATATFTADARGRITFATPAVELDAPQLSVQVVSDDDAGDDAGPLIVSPDADVHAFLAGAAPLNDLGTLSGTSLLATKADGTPLCPVLASLPGDQQSQAADAVASAVTECVKAGQGATPGPDDAKSWSLDMTQVPTYTSSTQSGGTQAPQLVGADQLGSLSSWWDSVKNDADSFFHGVRHDAVQIATCTANWVQDEATGAWQWAVSLAVSVENQVIGAADYVITDMKSAIHAVTGFFQKMGADIGDVITWLRQNVGELIAAAGNNAKTIEGWLGQLPGNVNTKLTEIGQLADGFFKNLEAKANQALDELASDVGDRTFGSSVPSPPSGTFDIMKFLSGAQHNWLLDKIESFGFSDTAAGQNTALQAAFDELAVAVQDGLQFVADLGETFYDALQAMFATSDSYRQAELADFLTQLKVTVDALLAFADAVVQALIGLAKVAMDQLGSMLSHGFEDIPLVSALLKHFGVDPTMNVAHVVSLVLMYPATLANRIKRGSTTPLFPGVSTGQAVSASELDWAFGLGLSSAVGQGIWGVADSVGDLQRVQGQEPSGIIGWIDIASPLILAILEWPGALNSDGTTAPPFANPIDGSGPDGAMIWPNWLLNLVPPIVGLCGQFADYKPPEAAQATGDAPEEWPEIGQWFTMAAAIASTVLGSIYNFNPEVAASAETQAAGILSNVSNIIAPFATKELAETTEGGSEIVKMFIDYLGNLGAAGCMGAALDG